MNTKFRQRLMASTLIVGVSAFAAPAYAQEQPQQPAEDTQMAPQEAVEATETTQGDIVVTGTLIRNPNLTSSSPVTVVGEAELQLRNINNAEEILRSLPGAVPAIGSAANNGNGGFATIDLRGLGFQRNLVLLDGNRISASDSNGVVDLNNIPLALIERVDVLTGGASTTYGADAVSGVVNFITSRNFTGMEAQAGYRITERGDGGAFNADLTIGANFDDGRGNAVLSIGYQKVDPIYQGDRDISVFGINSTTGVASGSSFTTVPAAFSFDTGDFQLNGDGNALVPFYAGFNFNPFNLLQTPSERKNIYGAAHYEVTDGVEVYARGLFSRNDVATIVAPSGIFGESLTVPANNPFLAPALRNQLCTLNGIALGPDCNNNAAIPLPAVYRRAVEVGPRISDYETTIFDMRAGVRVGVTDSITLDVSGAHGESDLVQTASGYVLRSRVQQALNASTTTACTVTTGGCVPLNLFGGLGSITPEQAAFLNGSTRIPIHTELTQARGVLSGDFGATAPWAAEPISFALGAEYRDYAYARTPDAAAQDPSELGGFGGAVTPFSGGYSVREAFAELIAPVVADRPFFNELTLEAGIRYSAYKIEAAGDPSFNTTTWKVGATWEPVEALRLRGNYQRAVRAPNIGELFTPVSTQLTNLLEDPCAGAAPLANPNLALACTNQGAPAGLIGSIQNPSAGQANATGGGNPNIQPEKANTFTVGAIFRPEFVPGLTVSIDYYNIKINDAITAATPDDIISACFGDNPAAITAAQANSVACTSIRRSTVNGRLSGSSATVPGLPQPLTNEGRLTTDGIDLAVNYRRDLGPVKLNFSFNGNWTNSLKFRASPSSLDRECVRYYSVNCGPTLGQIQPEFSWQQRTTLTMGAASLSLLWRHIGKVQYEPGIGTLFSGAIKGPSPLAGETHNFNRIEAHDYFDLAARFEVNDNFDFVVGVQNLLDREPPVVGSAAGSTTANSGNTFPATYDTLGRAFNVNARIRF
ncbi:MAG TPA: TonB-dependent receptor [Allosphingosinicella sp.]